MHSVHMHTYSLILKCETLTFREKQILSVLLIAVSVFFLLLSSFFFFFFGGGEGGVFSSFCNYVSLYHVSLLLFQLLLFSCCRCSQFYMDLNRRNPSDSVSGTLKFKSGLEMVLGGKLFL